MSSGGPTLEQGCYSIPQNFSLAPQWRVG